MSFDITKHEFSDFALGPVTKTDDCFLLVGFGNSWFHLHKQDAIAIAKHFGLTAEDLKDE